MLMTARGAGGGGNVENGAEKDCKISIEGDNKVLSSKKSDYKSKRVSSAFKNKVPPAVYHNRKSASGSAPKEGSLNDDLQVVSTTQYRFQYQTEAKAKEIPSLNHN